MKIPVPRGLFVLAGMLLALAARGQTSPWQPLFNGKDLSGWETWLGKPDPSDHVEGLARAADGTYAEPIGKNHDLLHVFSVEQQEGEGVIHVSGEIFGSLATLKSFSNYRVRLQFKWGDKRWPPRDKVVRDSGLMYHLHGPYGDAGGVWPASEELQIQEHDVGDLWTVDSFAWVHAHPKQGKQFAVYDPTQPLIELAQWESQNSSRCIKAADYEKPKGEWNTIELVCFGEEAIHIVNGHAVLRVHQMKSVKNQLVTRGPIALQSEGSEVFYRRIEIMPLTESPAELSAAP